MKPLPKNSRHTSHIRQHNNLLYEQLQYTGNVTMDTSLTITTFDETMVTQRTYSTVVDALKTITPSKVNWIRLCGLSDIKKTESLCAALGVPVLWTQDILNVHQMAKIEYSQQKVLSILDIFDSNTSEILGKEHIGLLLTPNVVVSFQETSNDYFKHISEAIGNDLGKVRHQNADYLYNLIISHITDNYLTILDQQRNDMLDMEDALMEFSSDHTDIMRDIQSTRKNYLLLRKNILPLCNEFHKLLKEGLPLIANENYIYYKDTDDHLQQVAQLIENAKENITVLVDLYMANNDLRINHIMSRLTILSAIFIPLTFLAGVWGMNFRHMPELEWQLGYAFAWGTMAITAVGIIFWLWRKKWF